jgi:polyhydroxyalkanoate synthase subunit PhaC
VLAPTPRDELFRDGSATLLRFVGRGQERGVPVLLVPSMINRWYVLDLRRGASLAEALVEAGLDVFCLDWGTPGDEDRLLSWDDVVARLGRMVRAVRRISGSPRVSLLGYCMGGTLAGIHSALEPDGVGALVNLLGPVDFAQGGQLRDFADERWFDAAAVGEAGNVAASQMQSSFVMLRPTGTISKWFGFLERAFDEEAREAFFALEAWAGDNIPFPGGAYVTYIRELYQRNQLVAGQHRIGSRRVDLRRIVCPVMVVTADKDTICPPAAATALLEHVGSTQRKALAVPGGHVGAVVGPQAQQVLYPAIADFLRVDACSSIN